MTGNNIFAYCGNNPVTRLDSSGCAWETIFDVISLGFSIAEVAANPYDPMAWVGLVGDTVDLIPFVTGVGEIVRGLRFINKAGDVLEIAESIDGSIDTYRSLRRLSKGTGNEVHHIIEKRFIDAIEMNNTNDMLSITLTKSDHRKYTNLWREHLEYGKKVTSKYEIFQAATQIYRGNPQLMGAAVQTLFTK